MKALEDSKREKYVLIDFILRKLLFFCLQRFLEVFIPCLSLMIVGKLQLAVVKEIGFENWVVGVVGCSFNASAEREIRIVFVKFEFYAKERFESISQIFESFSLTFNLQLRFG